ncbi:hypothetical protein PsorP6_007264 [Peronosclerospora sorghi]|uniref:Uncharacterized protein n=1 Tax=Peronosclerospora sorghi TaxID=230839 RepID=A0ACC0WA02_9STRA|nr:hypothetical protein PsorP6_007264 [Peronosclerospora sorghi]
MKQAGKARRCLLVQQIQICLRLLHFFQLFVRMPPSQEPSRPSTTASGAVLDSTWRGSRYSYGRTNAADIPAMLDAESNEYMARPSLLAFRPSRMLRMSHQHHPTTMYKQQFVRGAGRKSHDLKMYPSPADTVRASDSSEDDWCLSSDDGSSDAGSLYSPSRQSRDQESMSTMTEDEEKARYIGNSTRLNRVESVLAMMALPTSSSIPLLERMEDEDEDSDIDRIVCDPSKLPRTLIVDEEGLSISRETIMLQAANVPRGGVIKSGLLFKQGFGLRSGGWKVRFVVLTSTKMTFYREEHGRKRGEIDLAKCVGKSIEIMPRDSVFDGSQATMWRFAIRGKSRRVLLSAYKESDMKEWLRCLHVALAAKGSGVGRFTDMVVPSGTFLAEKSGGQLRSSGIS